MASISDSGSIQTWRLVKTRWAQTAFDGEGAYRFGGRWNSSGQRMVYTSSTLSLALLEILVHLDPSGPVPDLVAISLEIPLTNILEANPPSTSSASSSLRETRSWGDLWLKNKSSAAVAVSNSIVPIEKNYLINPAHQNFVHYKVGTPISFQIDPRFSRQEQTDA